MVSQPTWAAGMESEGLMRYILVRTGQGDVLPDGTFSDTVDEIERFEHVYSDYRWIRHGGRRYQVFGGIRTPYFIVLNHPLPALPSDVKKLQEREKKLKKGSWPKPRDWSPRGKMPHER